MTRPDLPFDQVPANRMLGMRLDAIASGSATLSMDPRPDLLQETGVVHGGILSALMDTAAVYSLVEDLADGRFMTSIEFKLNFLAPGRGDGGPLVAQATVVRQGRTVGVADVALHQGEALVAKGLFTYLFMDKR